MSDIELEDLRQRETESSPALCAATTKWKVSPTAMSSVFFLKVVSLPFRLANSQTAVSTTSVSWSSSPPWSPPGLIWRLQDALVKLSRSEESLVEFCTELRVASLDPLLLVLYVESGETDFAFISKTRRIAEHHAQHRD